MEDNPELEHEDAKELLGGERKSVSSEPYPILPTEPSPSSGNAKESKT